MFKEIPIAHTISSSETDFPIYVKPSAIDGWGALTTAEAESIRIYADEAKTTELPREVVSSDEIHVKKGTLANGDSIYVDYDGVRSDYAVTATFGAQNAWNSNYLRVYHMDDASGGITDSTGNQNGTESGTVTYSTSAELGDGIDFNNGLFNISTIPNQSAITISHWSRTDAGGTQGQIFSLDSNNGSLLRLDNGGVAGDVRFYQQGSTATGDFTASSQPTDTLSLYHQTAADGGTLRGYVNGSSVGSDNISGNLTQISGGDNSDYIGVARGGLGNIPLDGVIDEFRVLSTELSANWISIEYSNQNDPATFFGTATDVATGKRRAGFNIFF